MKVRAYGLTPAVARGIAVLCAALFVVSAPSTARAAGVVGTGGAPSCTDAALNAALVDGGLVTFNCGGPATIDISTGTGTKTIAADTTLDGGGMVTISGGHAVGVFSVNSGVNFTVNDLTIANGFDFNRDGGGIFNDSGTLTVTNSTFSGNSAAYGGGIYSNGTLTVTHSTFTGNRTAWGGGIVNDNGLLTVTNSIFSDNRASVGNSHGAGGGIYNTNGILTVTNSTFSSNSASGAGGFFGGDGGGIYNFNGILTVTNSTFSGNSVGGGGAGLLLGGAGGGIYNANGILTVTNSTFAGNSNPDEDRLAVGGIYNDPYFSGSLTVINSTFTGNVFTALGGLAVLRNTVVANSPQSCSDPITDGGHNLDDGTSCGFSTANGSLSNTDPQLDPAGLQDNGGPTQTVALCTAVGMPAGCTAASPAINAGDEAVCAAAPVNSLDQRGYVRPGVGATSCSIGAYEADATASEACVGDCTGTHTVAVNNLVTLVNIALGTAQPSACPDGVPSGATVDITLIIQAVNNALNGCPLTPEQGCLRSGGTVTTAICCASTNDFPDTCALGACGCSPDGSHEVGACTCGTGSCFDGTTCVGQ